MTKESRFIAPACGSSLFAGLLLLVLLAGCAGPAPRPAPDTHCSSSGLLLDAHFEGGQIGSCTIAADGAFELKLFPEDAPPINKSPWYAFRLSGQAGEDAVVRMTFEDGYARYWPKISQDGDNWQPLAENRVTRTEDGAAMEISVTLEQARVWISAQEILAAEYYRRWLNELAELEGIATRMVAVSPLGRPLYLAETADRPEIVLLVGRQHPPEVTGAIGMRKFIRTVLADTNLARRFSDRFKLVIVPLINPDGVAAGHWRHNENGVDLNRDWGPFTQPETAGIRQWLRGLEDSGMRIRLMLDFHSTREDLFYTQQPQDELDPPGFTTQWLTASRERLPDFPFRHVPSENKEQPNSKNYWFNNHGIAAVTYEVGDETPRDQIEHAAVVFAEEMMKAMLDSP